jgi:hypothetical protein
MERTTKIPCEGVIYTVHKDAYGTSIETDEVTQEVVVVPADDAGETHEGVSFAQILAELDELEETLAQAEEQATRGVHLDDHETEEDFLLFL